jgi:hypothetical protein
MPIRPSLIALSCGFLAAALLLFAGVALVQNASPSATPDEAIKKAQSARTKAAASVESSKQRSFKAAYDPAMIQDKADWTTDPKTPITRDRALVNTTPGADLEATARACVKAHSDGGKVAVQCYVFASNEAFDKLNYTKQTRASGQVKEGTFAITNLCWAVMASSKAGSQGVTISDMRAAAQTWDQRGCPASWKGSGK